MEIKQSSNEDRSRLYSYILGLHKLLCDHTTIQSVIICDVTFKLSIEHRSKP